MDDLFKDLVFLGGIPLDSLNLQLFQVLSVCQVEPNLKGYQLIVHQNQTEFYTMEQFECSLESNQILYNRAVRVFVKIMHGFTQ